MGCFLDRVSRNQKLFSQVDRELSLFIKNLKTGCHEIPTNLSIHAHTIGGKFLQDFLEMQTDLNLDSKALLELQEFREEILRLKHEVKEL